MLKMTIIVLMIYLKLIIKINGKSK